MKERFLTLGSFCCRLRSYLAHKYRTKPWVSLSCWKTLKRRGENALTTISHSQMSLLLALVSILHELEIALTKKLHSDARNQRPASARLAQNFHLTNVVKLFLPQLFLFPLSTEFYFQLFFRRSSFLSGGMRERERDSGMDQMDGQSEKRNLLFPPIQPVFPHPLFFPLCSVLSSRFASAQNVTNTE